MICTADRDFTHASGTFQQLTQSGSELYSIAADAGHGKELHHTNGSPYFCGAEDLNVGLVDAFDGNQRSGLLLPHQGGVLMVARWNSEGSSKLFRYDPGTGIQLVKPFSGGWDYVDVDGLGLQLAVRPRLTALNDSIVLFAVSTNNEGLELWRTNGTNAGTYMVKDIVPGAGDSDPRDLHVHQGLLYFTARTAANGREIWRSDGTEAGTALFMEIEPGPGDAFENEAPVPDTWAHFTSMGDTLFFTAFDSNNGQCLWRSDGTVVGSEPIHCVMTSITTPLFRDAMIVHEHELWFNLGRIWKSDGSSAGTVEVAPGSPWIMNPFEPMVSWNGDVYYGGRDLGYTSFGLCRSDGTPGGTDMVYPVIDLDPNTASIITMEPADGRFYFFTHESAHQTRLFRSDGTGPGTALIMDTLSYYPDAIVWDDHLWFTNNVGVLPNALGQLIRLHDGDIGVNEVPNAPPALQLFPNPAQSNVTLSANAPLGEFDALVLRDALGRVIDVSMQRSGNDIVLDLGALSPGCYHLQWRTMEGTVLQAPLVKQ